MYFQGTRSNLPNDRSTSKFSEKRTRASFDAGDNHPSLVSFASLLFIEPANGTEVVFPPLSKFYSFLLILRIIFLIGWSIFGIPNENVDCSMYLENVEKAYRIQTFGLSIGISSFALFSYRRSVQLDHGIYEKVFIKVN